MQEQRVFLTLDPPLQPCYLYSIAIKIKSKDTLGQIGHTSSPEGLPATLSQPFLRICLSWTWNVP